MSNFIEFKKAVKLQMDAMLANADGVFVADVDKDELWNLYLNSFPEGTNEIYRERREYDCSCCCNFIKTAGALVTVEEGVKHTIWDNFEIEHPFDVVSKKLSEFVGAAKIRDIFLTDTRSCGVGVNHEEVQREDGSFDIITWDHFYYKFSDILVSGDIARRKSNARSMAGVFARALDELSIEAAEMFIDLNKEGVVYRGAEYVAAVKEFIELKATYDKLDDEMDKDMFIWLHSRTSGIARIRNMAVGTMLVNLSEGMDEEEAVCKFNKIMAPENFMQGKAVFTKKALQAAKEKLVEIGCENSMGRKQAVLDDISVANVMFIDREPVNPCSDIFEEVAAPSFVDPRMFNRASSVSIQEFIDRILPNSSKIEILADNRHTNNFVSLIAPENPEAKSVMKWDNNYSWSYRGNLTDSSLKRNVEKAGGCVSGDLRFSIQWNESGNNKNDYDAHSFEPLHGEHIYYPNAKRKFPSSGMLDVDIRLPRGIAVENIVYSDKEKMPEGVYEFKVHNYCHRGGRDGFRAEIEFDGNIHSFEYNEDIPHNEYVTVACVRYTHKDGFKIVTSLNGTIKSNNVWNIPTNTFCEVSTVMLSPNYWDGQESNGNKHYFFFMKGCKCDETPRGFYNEYLDPALRPHRKAFQAVGSKVHVTECEGHLAGLGFSSTKRAEFIVKVDDAVYKVNV